MNRTILMIAVLWLVPLHAFYANELFGPGSFLVETLEFPDATMPTRDSENGVGLTRPSGLPGGFREAAKQGRRRLPIKLHLPADAVALPVVVVSHGAGGDWDTHYAQAKHLASHGYAVLCLEHVGSNRERMTQGYRLMNNLEAMIHSHPTA